MATRQTTRKSVGRATASARPGSKPGAAGGRPSTGPGASWRTLVRRLGSALGWAAAKAGAGWRALARWAGGGLPLTTLIVSLLGLADAAYLTYQHFSHASTFAGCSGNGTINCEAVTTSAWQYLFGTHLLPVSVLGLAFFAFMTAVNSPWGWRAPWPAVHWARLASVVVGIALVLYLIWAELFRINAICLYCTGVHVLTFILFALIVGRATFSGLRPVSDSG
jgi:uncharacterized membrane protein